eukprot:TRINITY_DN1718_c0_g2_i2.p1 TRINITY_DN1718_c0_g2~~TRINITY_DN1718_c0_g2_i2.p1  ORF type:complete len:281 (-),score=75.71 TRINITY_DN1718_c0_g2_i2:193-1035(-)
MSDQYKPVKLRSLNKARRAFDSRDIAASKAAHAEKAAHEENHSESGGYIKPIIYGGLDGIITTFAVVAGASGGGLGVPVILILGFSNIFADALSMGMGDALSSKAEQEFIAFERSREEWELSHNPVGEVEEMVDLYEKRGMKRADAEKVINIMAKYEEFFIDIMMVEELGLMSDEDENPWKSGAITFGAFVFFGTWPLLGYVIFPTFLETRGLFAVACTLAGIMLFILGALKSKITAKKWYWSGLEMLLLGAFTAAVAYLIGWFIETVALGDRSTAGGLH